MSKIRTGFVLAGVDGSSVGDMAVDYAAWLAKQAKAPLLLLHTIEHTHHSEQAGHEGNLTPNIKEQLLDELTDEERAESKQLIADGKNMLALAVEKSQQTGLTDITAKQRHGSLPETLVDIESQLAMVVLGAKGHDHNDEQQGLGAQLEDAIRAVHKPIFIAKSAFETPQKLMFAYNGSPTSQKALNLLKQLPWFASLDIHIVTVQKSLSDARVLVEDAKSVLADTDLRVTGQALTGDAIEALTLYQREHHIDITMMGAFSHGKLHGFFFGSFTTKMLLSSDTQFLLIR